MFKNNISPSYVQQLKAVYIYLLVPIVYKFLVVPSLDVLSPDGIRLICFEIHSQFIQVTGEVPHHIKGF